MKSKFCQIAEREFTVRHIERIARKSFQVENKETQCSDTKGTILGQRYFKGGVCFKEAPFET